MRKLGVYMVRCGDGSFYVGSTVDPDRRMDQHFSGGGGDYTSKRLPVELVYFEPFPDIRAAWVWEKKLQGWGRAKRIAVLEGRLSDLPALSRNRQRGVDRGLDRLDPRGRSAASWAG